ncbi:MAG: pantoate--beta-alanine ligase [Acidimicrobiales bacterium]
MALVQDRELLRKELDGARERGHVVGLVPTMGALHRGHASLIRRSATECGLTAVSIFVNPLQFGPEEDHSRYPRHLESDMALATEAGADVVFAPEVGDLWPGGAPATDVRVAGLSEMLEGASRPGHFTGVATVVTTLLGLAGPCRAYFGEKDYQQLLVVRRLVADLALPAEVVGCATVREPDGLACSSRNQYLSGPERAAAPVLHRALTAAAEAVRAGERNSERLRRRMGEMVAAEPLADLDYAEVVDATTVAPLAEVAGDARLVIAARIGSTRLIDNVGAGT